jgi:hypothetical protein
MVSNISETLVIPKPTHNILRRLTGETRPDVALSLALKDLVRLRREQAIRVIGDFEVKYGLPFEQFARKWQAGEIPEAHTYPVEQDYWNWEAAVSDVQALEELAGWLALVPFRSP